MNGIRNPLVNSKIMIKLCVLVSILLPLSIQSSLNELIRDMCNPPERIILLPNLRVISTLTCFSITYCLSLFCLISAKSKRWLFVLHAILTFLWCGFVAFFIYMMI